MYLREASNAALETLPKQYLIYLFLPTVQHFLILNYKYEKNVNTFTTYAQRIQNGTVTPAVLASLNKHRKRAKIL